MPENRGKRHARDEAKYRCRPPQVVDSTELKLFLSELTNRVPDGEPNRGDNDDRDQNPSDRYPVSRWFRGRGFG